MKATRMRPALSGFWRLTVDALFAAAVVCFNALLVPLLHVPAPPAAFVVLFAAFVFGGLTVRTQPTPWLRIANVGLRGSVIFGLSLWLLWGLGLLATNSCTSAPGSCP